MAAVTMTSSFLGRGSAAVPAASTKQPLTVACRSKVIMANASKVNAQKTEVKEKNEDMGNGRREMMFAAAAAAVSSVANIALADEPKRGSAEAKKKYAQVCVTNPTTRICRN